MTGKFAQENHVINAVVPVADTFATAANSDVISAAGCEEIVFLVMTGAGVDNTNLITVESCDTIVPGTATAIVFNYVKVITGDTHPAVTAATTSGVAMTASTANQFFIVMVDPADVAAANSDARDPYVRCTVTEAGNAGAQVGCVVGIRYKEHRAQDQTATSIT